MALRLKAPQCCLSCGELPTFTPCTRWSSSRSRSRPRPQMPFRPSPGPLPGQEGGDIGTVGDTPPPPPEGPPLRTPQKDDMVGMPRRDGIDDESRQPHGGQSAVAPDLPGHHETTSQDCALVGPEPGHVDRYYHPPFSARLRLGLAVYGRFYSLQGDKGGFRLVGKLSKHPDLESSCDFLSSSTSLREPHQWRPDRPPPSRK